MESLALDLAGLRQAGSTAARPDGRPAATGITAPPLTGTLAGGALGAPGLSARPRVGPGRPARGGGGSSRATGGSGIALARSKVRSGAVGFRNVQEVGTVILLCFVI